MIMQENSNLNPKSAIDSLLESPTKIGDITVYPISLGRYALLELVESPFIVQGKKFSISNLITTFYIMTVEYKDLVGFNSRNIDKLEQTAMLWAENFNTELTSQVIDEIAYKLGLIKKVAPDGSSDTSTKKEDAQEQTVG